MKIIPVFIALLAISLVLPSCDKEPTDSDPDCKTGHITVFTGDAQGYIIPGMRIRTVFYFNLAPTPMIAIMWTDGLGRAEYSPAAFTEHDTVFIYVDTVGYLSDPDSFAVEIEYDGQEFYLAFKLTPVSQKEIP